VNEIKIKLSGDDALHFLERLAQIENDLALCVDFIESIKEKDQTSQARKSSPNTV
jgi:hypothetical protein